MGSYCQVRGDAVLQVFVAFPYDPEPLEGYRALYREIEQTNSLVRFVFADERIASDMILNKIRDSIGECQFSLCDVTGWNPNVCLEFGLAIGMGRPVHILYRTARPGLLGRMVGRSPATPDLPIDMRGYDRIDYQDAATLRLGIEKLIEQELRNPDPGMASGMKLLQEKIFALIEDRPGLKKFEIARHLGLEVADIGPRVDALLRSGRIERRGKYQNTAFYGAGRAPPEVEDIAGREKSSAGKEASSVQEGEQSRPES
jgi:hypothetical protein